MTEEEFELETTKHINYVRKFLYVIIKNLLDRAGEHDASKLNEPERSVFLEFTSKLKDTTYGSEQYNEYLNQMKVALDHHYAENRHHPEHFENGINDMTLIDLIELLVDWKSSTLRHEDGDINKSIETNTKRFNLSPQLVSVLKNTVKEIEG